MIQPVKVNEDNWKAMIAKIEGATEHFNMDYFDDCYLGFAGCEYDVDSKSPGGGRFDQFHEKMGLDYPAIHALTHPIHKSQWPEAYQDEFLKISGKRAAELAKEILNGTVVFSGGRWVHNTGPQWVNGDEQLKG